MVFIIPALILNSSQVSFVETKMLKKIIELFREEKNNSKDNS